MKRGVHDGSAASHYHSANNRTENNLSEIQLTVDDAGKTDCSCHTCRNAVNGIDSCAVVEDEGDGNVDVEKWKENPAEKRAD